MSDSYVYPGTTVLKNKLGIRDQDELDQADHDLAAIGADVITDGYGPEKTFDREHLKGLHREMFKDVYEWAGSMRDETPVVDGEKVDKVEMLSKGNSNFVPGSMIDRGIAVATSHIADRDALREGTREEFAEKAGNALGELNHVHPFREGNGRTQRAFMEDLGRETGHDVDFRGITPTRMRDASIAVNNDPHVDDMRHVMRDATDPERIAALRELREKLDHSGYGSGNFRIATSRDDERIEGELMHRDERVAHVVSSKDIIVVNANDVPDRGDGNTKVSFTATPFDPSREASRAPEDSRSVEEPEPRVEPNSFAAIEREAPPTEERRVLTIDQEVEARTLALRITEAKDRDSEEYDKLLSETVRGDKDVASGAHQLVDESTAEDMVRHVQKMREEQDREADPSDRPSGRADSQIQDREASPEDQAETLHRNAVQAMRDELSEVDNPAILAAGNKLIERMEQSGEQFRDGREADRQTQEETARAASRTASERETADRQTATNAAGRDRSSQENARVEREPERDDDHDR